MTLVKGDPNSFLFQYLLHRIVGEGDTPALNCSTLPLIRTLYCQHQVSFFDSLVRPVIEPRSPEPLSIYIYICIFRQHFFVNAIKQ